MKSATVAHLKKELQFRSTEQLIGLCLRLARFKKENKELLTYLLFESDYEEGYVESIKEQITEGFDGINTDSFYYVKKSIRKQLRETKKYIRYSNAKETEVELLLHFCQQMKNFRPSFRQSKSMVNLYERQMASIEKALEKLHEDLQYDYYQELNALSSNN